MKAILETRAVPSITREFGTTPVMTDSPRGPAPPAGPRCHSSDSAGISAPASPLGSARLLSALEHTAIPNIYRASRDLFLARRIERHARPLATVAYTPTSVDELRKQLAVSQDLVDRVCRSVRPCFADAHGDDTIQVCVRFRGGLKSRQRPKVVIRGINVLSTA